MVNHAERAHAKRSPSGSERWINCPGSIREEEGLPDKDNVYAIEGTAAHQLSEICMRKSVNPQGWLGENMKVKLLDGSHTAVEVTKEMVAGAQMYVTWFRDQIEDAEIWKFPNSLFLVETKVKIAAIEDTGTADGIIYKERTKTLVIGDLKFGFNLVDPEENTQGLLYAMGAAALFPAGAIDWVEIVIIQPRGIHPDGPIRMWRMKYDDMLDWELFLFGAVEKTKDPLAPLKAGSWCKYCKAAETCKTLREKALDSAVSDFTPKGEIILKEPSSLTPVQLGAILESVGALKVWLKRMEDYAEAEAQAGRVPPGFKLVAKRANRSWKDEAAAKAELEMLGYEDIYTEPKMKSPAQVEETFGKKKVETLVKNLTQSISSGSKLVADSDPRQLSRPSAESDFGIV